MASKNSDDKDGRVAKRRLRAYQARKTVHEHRTRRRVRDNWLISIAVVVVAVGAAFAQVAYLSGGDEESASPSPTASASELSLPDPSLSEDRDWTGTMQINGIDLGLTLDGEAAPQGVANFVYLSQKDFYDGLSCHRLTTSDGFGVLQCGDPEGDGSGGPGYSWGPIENAPKDDFYPAGTVAMARQGGKADSMGSQFFIVYEDTTIPSDDAGGYTVLGTVTDGLDELKKKVVDKGTDDGSEDGTPAVETTITSISLQ